jgi:hypothetical protein
VACGTYVDTTVTFSHADSVVRFFSLTKLYAYERRIFIFIRISKPHTRSVLHCSQGHGQSQELSKQSVRSPPGAGRGVYSIPPTK